MPSTGTYESSDADEHRTDPAPQTLAQIAGLLAALWNGEIILARAALHEVRRALILAAPGLLIAGALLLVAIGQASFALVAGLLAAGFGPALAHLGTSLLMLLLAGLVLWLVYRRLSQASTGVKRVAQSLRADLKMLAPGDAKDPPR